MICEVCHNVGNNIFSVYMVDGNSYQECENEGVTHAKRFGYELVYVKEIPDWKVRENMNRRMPIALIKAEG